MSEEQAGNAQAIIDAVERYHGVKLEKPLGDDGPVLALVPSGVKLESIKKLLDEYRLVPERKTGITTLSTLGAFVAFVNRQKTSDSIIFVDDLDIKAPRLLAIFNPHKAEAVSKDDVGPDNGDHRALYKFPLSDEWKAWTGLPAKLSQAQFARFLEDHIGDVCPIDDLKDSVKRYAADLQLTLASPSKLLELSKGLSINVDAKVAQHLNLSTGEGSLLFAESHSDSSGAPMKVPGAFGINIPVFRLGEPFNVPVRLSYRARVGELVDWYLTPQWLDKVFEAAISDVHINLETRCQLPVFRGAP